MHQAAWRYARGDRGWTRDVPEAARAYAKRLEAAADADELEALLVAPFVPPREPEAVCTLVLHGALPRLGRGAPRRGLVRALLAADVAAALGDDWRDDAAPSLHSLVAETVDALLREGDGQKTPDEWALLAKVAPCTPVTESASRRLALAALASRSLLHGGPHRAAAAAVALALQLDADTRFLLDMGPNWLLYGLYADGPDGAMAALLSRCLAAHPEYVVHAPCLVRGLELLLLPPPHADAAPAAHVPPAARAFVEALVWRAGTALPVRLVREAAPCLDRLLAALRRVCSAAAIAHLVRLWPTKLGGTTTDDPVTDAECPITLMPMVDPVVASDGHTYERDAILDLIVRRGPSPFTRDPLDTLVVPHRALLAAGKAKKEDDGAAATAKRARTR
jgi:hypothetical protein